MKISDCNRIKCLRQIKGGKIEGCLVGFDLLNEGEKFDVLVLYTQNNTSFRKGKFTISYEIIVRVQRSDW